jgi:hypothetical protein
LEQGEQCPGDHHKNGQNSIFGFQKCQRTLVDVLGDFGHAGLTRVLFAHPSRLDGHHHKAKHC